MKISIFGTGYVGLVTGTCLAEMGHDVICVDVDPQKVASINEGVPLIHERDLTQLLQKNLNVHLRATTDGREAVLSSDLSMIAVGTPTCGNDIDLSQVEKVAQEIGETLRQKKKYHLIVVKSTVVPGTTDEVVLPILKNASGKRLGTDFGVGMNPEFLTEGQAVQDFMHPDRIVLGGIDKRGLDLLQHVYENFPPVPRLRTNNKTAEMIKYTSNALLATMISFSNEIANLCAAIGDIDVLDVMEAVHQSQYLSCCLPNGNRVMPSIVSFLGAGCGFGGSCLPKDVKALRAYGEKVGAPMRLLDAVLRVNEGQSQRVVSLVKKHFSSLRGLKITILGLAFRPDTNDMRESPAIPIIKQLVAEGADVKAYDPIAKCDSHKLFGDSEVLICNDLTEAIGGVQAIILVTRWEEFRKIPELLIRVNPRAVFIDGRRMLDKHSLANYEGIGLGRLMQNEG